MTTIPWPAVLKPQDFGFFHIDADTSGGQGTGGGEQFVVSPGPRWGARMTLPIHSRETVLAVRSLRSQLKGRVNPAQLPNFDGQRLSWPVEAATGRVLTPAVGKYIEGTLGLDDTSFAGAAIPTVSQINATIQSAAALRATQVIINITQGGALEAGQQFGIGSSRLYEIAKIVSVAGANTTVDIWPPLRAAATAGTAIQMPRAWCLMRCTNMSDELHELELMRFATLTLDFVEYF